VAIRAAQRISHQCRSSSAYQYRDPACRPWEAERPFHQRRIHPFKGSLYLRTNEEISLTIQFGPDPVQNLIEGMACISRIMEGEGLAVYFTKMDDVSTSRLRNLLQQNGF